MSASFSRGVCCSILHITNKISTEETMRTIFGRMAAALLALVLTSGLAVAQIKITVAVGGGAWLCYLPTVLAKQLGEYDKAAHAVELEGLQGGSGALQVGRRRSGDLEFG